MSKLIAGKASPGIKYVPFLPGVFPFAVAVLGVVQPKLNTNGLRLRGATCREIATARLGVENKEGLKRPSPNPIIGKVE